MNVKLKDNENKKTSYSYTIEYTNSAPYFLTAPTATTITTPFSQ